MKVVLRALDDIKPYARNPRINDAAVDAVVASIRQFGFRVPIVVDAKSVIIAGHTRWKAAQVLGLKRVPVHVASDLTPAQVKALRLADNKTAELSTWDAGALKLEMLDLKAAAFDLATLGFSAIELSKIFDDQAAGEASDALPAPSKKSITRRGDLWTLGTHRLLCGDSTSRAEIDRLMSGAKADLVFTDPPYGVSYQSRAERKTFKAIEGDNKTNDALLGLLVPMFKQAARVTREAAAWYVWHASSTRDEFCHALKAAGIMERQYIIWIKPSIVLGHADYHWSHEPCFYASRQGHQPAFYGDRAQSTVWRATLQTINESATTIGQGIVIRDGRGGELAVLPRVAKGKKIRSIRLDRGASVLLAGENSQQTTWEVAAEKNVIHPTQKPVELARRAIQNSTQAGGIVLDVCGGSGSTLIGAELENRGARLMDIEPSYCDGIVARWEKLSGKKAERRAAK